LPVGSDRGEARHGGYQERTGHGATGQGGDRGAPAVRGPSGAAVAPPEAQAARAGPLNSPTGARREIIACACSSRPSVCLVCSGLPRLVFYLFACFCSHRVVDSP